MIKISNSISPAIIFTTIVNRIGSTSFSVPNPLRVRVKTVEMLVKQGAEDTIRVMDYYQNSSTMYGFDWVNAANFTSVDITSYNIPFGGGPTYPATVYCYL